jgi:hypothetical protein
MQNRKAQMKDHKSPKDISVLLLVFSAFHINLFLQFPNFVQKLNVQGRKKAKYISRRRNMEITLHSFGIFACIK